MNQQNVRRARDLAIKYLEENHAEDFETIGVIPSNLIRHNTTIAEEGPTPTVGEKGEPAFGEDRVIFNVSRVNPVLEGRIWVYLEREEVLLSGGFNTCLRKVITGKPY